MIFKNNLALHLEEDFGWNSMNPDEKIILTECNNRNFQYPTSNDFVLPSLDFTSIKTVGTSTRLSELQ